MKMLIFKGILLVRNSSELSHTLGPTFPEWIGISGSLLMSWCWFQSAVEVSRQGWGGRRPRELHHTHTSTQKDSPCGRFTPLLSPRGQRLPAVLAIADGVGEGDSFQLIIVEKMNSSLRNITSQYIFIILFVVTVLFQIIQIQNMVEVLIKSWNSTAPYLCALVTWFLMCLETPVSSVGTQKVPVKSVPGTMSSFCGANVPESQLSLTLAR